MNGNLDLRGFIKNGLDSSILINLIVAFDGKYDEYKKEGFTFPPNLFYFHEVSKPEVIGVLINSYGFTKEDAKEALKNLIEEFGLSEIKRKDKDSYFEKIIEEANRKMVVLMRKPSLRIGRQDITIIGGFLRENINMIHSADEGFIKTCRELKVKTYSLPLSARKKEEEIKKWSRSQ